MDGNPEEARGGHDHHGHHDGHGHEHYPTTTIVVNNNPVYIHPGNYTVAVVKKLASVPQADDLDQLVESTLKPIPDDATLHLHGCEIFISHVKDGGHRSGRRCSRGCRRTRNRTPGPLPDARS